MLLSNIPRPLLIRVALLLGILALVNILLWVIALILYRPYSSAIPSLVLAYTLGLRHAVDADHIAAIDNVTRKLSESKMESHKYPITVGFWFALGHSTIVVVATCVFAATAHAINETGWGITGTIVSSTFLYLIALCNVVVLVSIIKTIHSRRKLGKHYQRISSEQVLNTSGPMARIFRPVFNFIDAPWKMYPLGVLFGLGFDTATEISLLAISASQATQVPLALVLFLPALFTAGMTLIDTTDGILMLATYTYATIHPTKKLFYNLTVTLLSIIIAFFIGTVQVLGIIAEKYDLEGGAWDGIRRLGEEMGLVGYIVIGMFVGVLGVAGVVFWIWKWDEEDEDEGVETVVGGEGGGEGDVVVGEAEGMAGAGGKAATSIV
ncbi:hypothetical protein HDV00_001928 [Rhizophlyctis rosea]|nr:hypothetical protein HDV00_001928 [Rhizophlyctis rosea]